MRQMFNIIKNGTSNAESRANISAFDVNIRVSVLSIALHGSFLAYLISSGETYSVNLCRTPYVTIFLVLIEALKHIYLRRRYEIDGATKPLVSGVNRFESASRTSNNQTKWLPLVKKVGLCCSVLISSMLFYAFVSIVLGAPYYQNMETLSLAAVLTISTVLPIVLFIGSTNTYKLLFSETIELRTPLAQSYLDLLKDNCIGVILGAWAASVVAPLDWDRPWQVYPVPNVVGAILGALGTNVFRFFRMVCFGFHERIDGKNNV
ncbi:uncharacterized protein LOC129769395 [Toxorhynchites rutilus septentrionalis]|uniref:uncharacterized protein LOC129769395 n=1 Tax=Toxorhynchites rutilus septentrionalis TaxID=329112 RepID=UPI0024790ADD|nr:uncharacterized protein LOC129769395 [Toxorhynchites rutilus septentrionalis]